MDAITQCPDCGAQLVVNLRGHRRFTCGREDEFDAQLAPNVRCVYSLCHTSEIARAMKQQSQIIASSEWRQGNCERPARIVLRRLGGYQPFATHIEVRTEDGNTYTAVGHYFTSLTAARVDFEQRAARDSYRPAC